MAKLRLLMPVSAFPFVCYATTHHPHPALRDLSFFYFTEPLVLHNFLPQSCWNGNLGDLAHLNPATLLSCAMSCCPHSLLTTSY